MEPFSTAQNRDEQLTCCPRVVRLGGSIYVSGTTGTDELGRVVGIGDAQAQFIQALKNVEIALATVGADRRHIVSVRVLVLTDSHRELVRQAYQMFLGETAPPLSFLIVPSLLDPLLLVEVEADAVLT